MVHKLRTSNMLEVLNRSVTQWIYALVNKNIICANSCKSF